MPSALRRADLTAAKVIPDVLSGIDATIGVQLNVRFGLTPVSTGLRLSWSQTAHAPIIQARHRVSKEAGSTAEPSAIAAAL